MPGGARLTDRPFSRETRRDSLARLDGSTFDIAVIGGGITGAGTARDAALRGFKVLLAEQGDFASGTSSASSKLIHGGLRYLAQGHLSLVFEALSERRILRRLAPHLVRPLDFLFPVYAGDPTGLTRLRLGVSLYDVLAFLGSEKRHRSLSKEQVAGLEKGLATEGLEGGLTYYDCRVDDARLTLENAIDAHELGGVILNYTRVEEIDAAADRMHRLNLTDVLSGRRMEIRARAVVNATGAWCERLTPPGTGLLLRPTRGVHLVLEAERFPVSQAVVMQTRDGRVLFAIPWGTHSYIGTTDTEDATDPARVPVTLEDVDYLLGIVNRYFPAASLRPGDVTSAWAGLRPLIRNEKGSPSDVPREHEVIEHHPGFVTVAGGKLTTYRRMAREIVDRLLPELERHGRRGDASRTHERRLPGGQGMSPARETELVTQMTAAGLEPGTARHLVETYGARHRDVLASGPLVPFFSGRPWLRGELDYALAREMVVLPEDFVMRRTSLFHKAPDRGQSVFLDLAARLGESVAEALERFETLVQDHRPVDVSSRA